MKITHPPQRNSIATKTEELRMMKITHPPQRNSIATKTEELRMMQLWLQLNNRTVGYGTTWHWYGNVLRTEENQLVRRA